VRACMRACVHACVRACVHACVRERETERKKQKARKTEHMYLAVCIGACVYLYTRVKGDVMTPDVCELKCHTFLVLAPSSFVLLHSPLHPPRPLSLDRCGMPPNGHRKLVANHKDGLRDDRLPFPRISACVRAHTHAHMRVSARVHAHAKYTHTRFTPCICLY